MAIYFMDMRKDYLFPLQLINCDLIKKIMKLKFKILTNGHFCKISNYISESLILQNAGSIIFYIYLVI
jgi:hypothetical protein